MANSNVPSLLSMDVKPNINSNALESECDSDYFVRIRGLPFSATIEDVLDFFSGECEMRCPALHKILYLHAKALVQ